MSQLQIVLTQLYTSYFSESIQLEFKQGPRKVSIKGYNNSWLMVTLENSRYSLTKSYHIECNTDNINYLVHHVNIHIAALKDISAGGYCVPDFSMQDHIGVTNET